MKIKLTQSVLVGGSTTPSPANSVVEVDAAEGNALISVGYAKESTAALTDNAVHPENAIGLNTVAVTADDSAAAARTVKAGAPKETK